MAGRHRTVQRKPDWERTLAQVAATPWISRGNLILLRARFHWLKLAGGAIVGLYGAFTVAAIVLLVVGLQAEVPEAWWMLPIAIGTAGCTFFGAWVFTSE